MEDKVVLHYIKGGGFRVVHVDGALGGVAPSGMLVAALYNERPAIPVRVVHKLDAAGRLEGEPIEVTARDGFVRELEVELVMTLEVAKSLREWLTGVIAQAETVRTAGAEGKP